MTTPVLFVQGAGDDVDDGWDAKLVERLERQLGPDYRVLYPRMPDERAPRHAIWKAALLEQLATLGTPPDCASPSPQSRSSDSRT